MYDENYLEWVRQAGLPPLTGGQVVFATWLIKQKDHISKIGNLEIIFESVRKWVKTNPELWVEVELKEEETVNKIPVIPEPVVYSEPFNWNISFSEMESKYLLPSERKILAQRNRRPAHLIGIIKNPVLSAPLQLSAKSLAELESMDDT